MKGYLIYNPQQEIFLLENSPKHVPGYALVNIDTKQVYLLEVYTPIQLDDDTIQVGTDFMSYDQLQVYQCNDELAEILNQDPSQIVLKNTLQKIPSAFEANFPPYTKIMVNYLQMRGKEKPLPKELHHIKCGLIRELLRTIDSQREMNLNKMQTLMEFYDLKLMDIFKEEYLIKN